MVPTKGDINDVGFIFSSKGLQVLGRVVGVVLLDVNLLSLSPNIDIGLHLGESLSSLI